MPDPRMRVLADGLVYPESPRWRNGAWYVSDVHAFRLLHVAPDGAVRVLHEVPGRPAGLGWLPDGRLVLATALDCLLLTEETDGRLRQHATLRALVTGRLNDMVVDEQGRAWVGDTGRARGDPYQPGRLIRVDADGHPVVVAENLNFPNGIAITPDGTTMYVAETWANRITSFTIEPDGSLTGRTVHAVLDGIPDGVCLDDRGTLWVALPELARVDTVGPTGEVAPAITIGDWRATAICFGGPERSTLLCALARIGERGERAGRLVVFDLDVSGAGLP